MFEIGDRVKIVKTGSDTDYSKVGLCGTIIYKDYANYQLDLDTIGKWWVPQSIVGSTRMRINKTKCFKCGTKFKTKKIKDVIQRFCPSCLDKEGTLGSLHRNINLDFKETKTGGKIVTFDRFVGIEIEAAGSKKWKLSECLDIPNDCGIGQDAGGIEVRLPPRKKRSLETVVRQSCRALKAAGFVPTQRCGLHVHLDFNQEKKDRTKMIQLYRTYYAVEDMLFHSLPQHRRRRPYTPFMSKDYSFFDDRIGGNAMREQLSGYGTIEFRSHEGTIDEEEICRWSQVLLAIADYAMNRYNEQDVLDLFKFPPGSSEKREAIYTLLSFTPRMREYIENRTKQFKASVFDSEKSRDNYISYSEKYEEIVDGKPGIRKPQTRNTYWR